LNLSNENTANAATEEDFIKKATLDMIVIISHLAAT